MIYKYNIIYADPPYEYKNKRTGGSMSSGSASKYSVLSTQDICDLEVPSIINKNSVLFLWGTVPMLPDAFKIMDAWGFKYKTMLTWRKIMSLGMGYWFRGQCEHLLLGVRGKVKAFRCQKPNFIQCKSLKHSKKPEEFRKLIEMATINMDDIAKIELFATDSGKIKDGWVKVGNEINGQDIRNALEQIKNGEYL